MRDYFKFSWILYQSRKIRLPILLLSLGFWQLWLGISGVRDFFSSREPWVEIYGTGQEGLEEALTAQGISITPYMQAPVEISFGEYSGQVLLCGAKRQFLEERYGDFIAFPMEEGKPYALLEEQALSTLKNSQGKTMEIAERQEYVARNFRIGQEDGREMRICGILSDESKTQEGEAKEQTEPKAYVDLETFYKMTGMQEETGQQETVPSYLVLLPSESSFQEEVLKLEEMGFSIENQDRVEEELQKWETLWMQTRYHGIFAGLLLLWGSTMGHLQGRLWRKSNGSLTAYLKSVSQSGRLGRIWAFHWIWVVLLSLGISILLFLASMAAGAVV